MGFGALERSLGWGSHGRFTSPTSNATLTFSHASRVPQGGVEELLGPLAADKFAQLVAIGKLITDWTAPGGLESCACALRYMSQHACRAAPAVRCTQVASGILAGWSSWQHGDSD